MKGGDIIIVLVVLKGWDGLEYLFMLNSWKDGEFEIVKNFLFGLLKFIGENFDDLKEKVL